MPIAADATGDVSHDFLLVLSLLLLIRIPVALDLKTREGNWSCMI
jgi:hypothetical protein